jgi:hypothetical protein
MLGKITIGFLSLCLVAVIALYISSLYQADKVFSTATMPTTTSTLATKEVATVAKHKEPVKASSEEQPDKSLPIPAHQLKKILAESEGTEVSPELQVKIDSANQAIEELNQQLPDNQAQASVPATSTDMDESNNKNIAARLQNIRDHLEQ